MALDNKLQTYYKIYRNLNNFFNNNNNNNKINMYSLPYDKSFCNVYDGVRKCSSNNAKRHN